jgi:exonuclease III
MSVRFKAKARNVTTVQCYAPTERADGETNERFYVELQNTIKSVNKKKVLIVMGDLNAKVGSSNVGLEHIMGKHGLGAMNNGEFFC